MCTFCYFVLSSPKPLPLKDLKDPRTLGAHILRRRLKLRLTQREVARLLGVKPETLLNWEKGRRRASFRYFPKIAEFLTYMPLFPEPQDFGSRIVHRRRLLGLSQKDLARKLKVDPSTLARWERGKRRPARIFLKKLEEILGDLKLPDPKVNWHRTNPGIRNPFPEPKSNKKCTQPWDS